MKADLADAPNLYEVHGAVEIFANDPERPEYRFKVDLTKRWQ